ncbi:hypothetical protein NW754_014801 [Fusarium falciforme]|uniref:SDR family NAD(P)-dependent oxidoreductase n=1 Tax=Fusarium falciforme TaxID=195108 RepID=A0A9W8R0M6_9HYPO|nr:hypothetical protein NW754_014801 [Fusarium falciforme]KAJ4183631.1 hypothetical protein NW755_009665 [Fusarium falciforme]KAJ4246895.1 hypothetical protein NW757_009046 [Fusarium falciforme]
MKGKLHGKVAVVTGASSGMGRAIAIALAGEGAKIALCDLQEKANAKGYEADVDKTTGDIIAARGGDSIFLQTDIASSTAVQETFSRALEASFTISYY